MEWYLLHFLACRGCLSTSLLMTAFILQRPLRGFQTGNIYKPDCLANRGVIFGRLGGMHVREQWIRASIQLPFLPSGWGARPLDWDWGRLLRSQVSLIITPDNSNWRLTLADKSISTEHITEIKTAPLTLSTFTHPFGLILSSRISRSIFLKTILLVKCGHTSSSPLTPT